MSNLSSFVSEKPCPRCHELLHWSQHEHPPTVNFDTRTGHIWGVSLMRFCIACGYREVGTLGVNRDPVWKEQKEELSR